MAPARLEEPSISYEAVDRAFSKQSIYFDEQELHNPILQDLRTQVYGHVARFIRPNSSILEINAGTGIDAFHFASLGHRVHATDVSNGMIAAIMKKISISGDDNVTCERLSFDQLSSLSGQQFDYVFSNFGGLNCIDDLKKVTSALPGLLNSHGIVTFVIMPKICPVEMLSFLRGNFKSAFRRLTDGGVQAHLAGHYFKTYYHSLSSIKDAFGKRFDFIASEGLACLSPQPHSYDFANNYPRLYQLTRFADSLGRHHFPFNRWADHIIVTFKFKG